MRTNVIHRIKHHPFQVFKLPQTQGQLFIEYILICSVAQTVIRSYVIIHIQDKQEMQMNAIVNVISQ